MADDRKTNTQTMTLAFMTHYSNGKRTNFVERIRRSLYAEYNEQAQIVKGLHETFPHKEETYRVEDSMKDVTKKIHTIRRDKSKRWKVGNKIHFVINNRTPKRYQFAPVVLVKSIQDITITEMLMTQTAYCVVSNDKIFKVEIDGRILHKKEVEQLAINDGFESVDAFFEYFNEDFKGRLINWTNYKY